MRELMSFGSFLKSKRQEREITVRLMAEQVGVAPGYYCDFESGRRNPPDKETLDKIIAALRLLDNDIKVFYDLAGKARSAAPPDLPEYINENAVVRVALRIAKEKAGDDDWQRFIDSLERKDDYADT
jgi:transcriptional regulator with XRE-family HTH domain